MINRLIPLWIVLALAWPASASAPKRETFEIAIDNAMQYLANAQNPDGSWNSGNSFRGGFGGGGRDPAISALCVMAFLSAGHVPGEGRYGPVIEKGVRFVASQQQSNGVFAAQQFGMSVMYSHGICTLMVAEVVGLMPDRAEAAKLRKQLEYGVRLIKAAQSHRGQNIGGWRYQITPGDADMSVTAWQVMALRAAKNVGCDVPATIIDQAVDYVKRSQDRNTTWGFRYTPYGRVTLACTGAGILSLELCRKEFHGSEESTNAAKFLANQLANDANRDGDGHYRRQQHFFYGVYYMSQAMFQVGGNYWKWYREYLHWLLLHPNANRQAPGGFWNGVSGDDQMAGVNYCTAMAVLALTVEYRFLPIYQRGDEPEERGDK